MGPVSRAILGEMADRVLRQGAATTGRAFRQQMIGGSADLIQYTTAGPGLGCQTQQGNRNQRRRNISMLDDTHNIYFDRLTLHSRSY